jgi:hypothetical protein
MAEGESQRLLIVAGAHLADISQLPPAARALVDGASEIFVVTPSLPSEVHLWTDDIDRARREADARLDAILTDLEMITSDSQSTGGMRGDQVPLTAFDDAVRNFKPTSILIALRAADRASWQEHGLVEQVEVRFHLPVTVFEVNAGGQVAAAD